MELGGTKNKPNENACKSITYTSTSEIALTYVHDYHRYNIVTSKSK